MKNLTNNLHSTCYGDLTSEYCAHHTSEEPALLKELDRITNLRTMFPRMMSGHLQGRFLKMITCMMKPKNVLEIGTFTGYATLCFAEGLPDDGKIYTIEVDEEYKLISSEFFRRGGMQDKIVQIYGDAMIEVPKLDMTFDLVFIDADKRNLKKYYNMLLPKVNQNGIILIDNVLWSGKIVTGDFSHDPDAVNIDEFNKYISGDDRVECLMLPIRDGIMMARKK